MNKMSKSVHKIKIIFLVLITMYFGVIDCLARANKLESQLSPTTSLYSETPKPDIAKSNNLRRKNGKQAKGKYIKIVGKVVDTK